MNGHEEKAPPARGRVAAVPAIPRRVFLRKTALGTAVLGLSSLLPEGCAKYEPLEEKPTFLSTREYRILEALADTFVPRGGPIPQSASDIGVPRALDRYLATEDPDVAGEFRSALLLLEFGPPLHSFRFRRFTRMSPEERGAYLEAWLTSRIAFKRMVAGGMKKAVLFVFYCHDEVWPPIGYDGPWVAARPAARDPGAGEKGVDS